MFVACSVIHVFLTKSVFISIVLSLIQLLFTFGVKEGRSYCVRRDGSRGWWIYKVVLGCKEDMIGFWTHRHIHAHTNTHTDTHTRTHKHTLTSTHTHADTHPHTHTPTYAHCEHTHTHRATQNTRITLCLLFIA